MSGNYPFDRSTPYMPTPQEIQERKQKIIWLQRQGFSDNFISSVMYHDSPKFEDILKGFENHSNAAQLEIYYKDQIFNKRKKKSKYDYRTIQSSKEQS